jgi:TPR repeat protein
MNETLTAAPLTDGLCQKIYQKSRYGQTAELYHKAIFIMSKLLRTFSLAGLVALAPFMPFSTAQAENVVNSCPGNCDDQLSIEQLLKKARHDVVSMSNVGMRYRHGQGVPVDYAKAMYWYQKAYKAGNIGVLYQNGLGVKQDYQAAMKWYQTAWQMSHLDDTTEGKNAAGSAASNIGFLYIKGRGVKEDMNKAYEWYQKGMERGNSVAFTNTAVLFWEHGNQEQKNQAIGLWQEAARMGEPNAQNELRQRGKGW